MARYIPDKTCRQCSGPIPWREGQGARNKAMFCGQKCRLVWQRNPVNSPNYKGAKLTATCQAPDCGKTFSYYPSVRPNARACSNACRHVLHSVKMTGRRPNNGIYTSPTSFRISIRIEFHDRCGLCGWDEAPCDVAHIIPRKNGGADTLDNVTMLCPNHHRMYDLGLIPEEYVRASQVLVLKHLITHDSLRAR